MTIPFSPPFIDDSVVAEVTDAFHSGWIIPVDINWWPRDYDAIMRLVSEAEVVKMFCPSSEVQAKLGRIFVVNDSAHSIGSGYGGRNSGTQTDITQGRQSYEWSIIYYTWCVRKK